MKKNNDFIKPDEVTALHIERRNRHIDRLLLTQAPSEEDYDNGKVNKNKYYKERKNKIKAFSDAIDLMVQKERLLQFHTTGFKINITQETKEIHFKREPRLNTEAFTLEEMVELLQLMQKAKKHQTLVEPITSSQYIEPSMIEDISYEMLPVSNIEEVKIEQLPGLSQPIPIRASDPTIRLRESLNRLAAQKFREAGGKLTEEEEKLI